MVAYIMVIEKKINLQKIIAENEHINKIIDTIRLIDYEYLYSTGGTLRNAVWASLHAIETNTKKEDCDIIFYNSSILNKNYEETIRNDLQEIYPKINWSVKNQARMHIRNGHKKYKDILDALKAFPETASAIAIGKKGELLTPYRTKDLLNLTLRPTPFCAKNELEVFDRRVLEKKWLIKWPKLKLKQPRSLQSI